MHTRKHVDGSVMSVLVECIVSVERGRRKGTDKGTDQGRGAEGWGVDGGWKWRRAKGREATSRPERGTCKGEEADSRGLGHQAEPRGPLALGQMGEGMEQTHGKNK